MAPLRNNIARALLIVACALSPSASADTFVLLNGDRISGQLLGESRRGFRIETPYGRVLVPRKDVERWMQADGRETIVTPRPQPPPLPTPPPMVRLDIAVTGASFWYAWDNAESIDTSLRFSARLDAQPLLAMVDTALNLDDLPGALVNTFNFDPLSIESLAPRDIRLLPPDIETGRVVLQLMLPPGYTGNHELHLAYQINTGTIDDRTWLTVASASVPVYLQTATPTHVQLEQSRGAMEFSGFLKRHMKRVDTFILNAYIPDVQTAQ
jgi:hypothetical protein